MKVIIKNEVMEIIYVNRSYVAYTPAKLKKPDNAVKILICKALLNHIQSISKYLPRLVENKTNFWKLIAYINH